MSDIVLLRHWMESQVEFWKPIEGKTGYDVSSFGRVRSWRMASGCKGGGTISVRRKEPRILKPYTNKYGYVVIGIDRRFGVTKGANIKPVHQHVARAFLSNPEHKPSVNHITGLKSDNRLDNLEWATRSEQSKHAWANGLHKRDPVKFMRMLTDVRQKRYDLPEVVITMIRNMLADGISQGQVRRWSGLKATTIQSIAVGRTYKAI